MVERTLGKKLQNRTRATDGKRTTIRSTWKLRHCLSKHTLSTSSKQRHEGCIVKSALPCRSPPQPYCRIRSIRSFLLERIPFLRRKAQSKAVLGRRHRRPTHLLETERPTVRTRATPSLDHTEQDKMNMLPSSNPMTRAPVYLASSPLYKARLI